MSEGPLSERSVYCSLKFALNDAVCLSWGDVFSSIKIKYTLTNRPVLTIVVTNNGTKIKEAFSNHKEFEDK